MRGKEAAFGCGEIAVGGQVWLWMETEREERSGEALGLPASHLLCQQGAVGEILDFVLGQNPVMINILERILGASQGAAE